MWEIITLMEIENLEESLNIRKSSKLSLRKTSSSFQKHLPILLP